MSVAAYKIRKRLQFMRDMAKSSPDVYDRMSYEDGMDDALEIVDEELEKEAERAFTQPINPQIG